MEEVFVKSEQGDKLKKLGFDWKCIYYYEGNGDYPSLRDSSHFLGKTYVSEFYHNFNDTTHRHGQPGYPRCSAPTLSQAQRWLREKKSIKVYIKPLFSSEQYEYWISFQFKGYGGDEVYGVEHTWEKALSKGIDVALNLIINDSVK